MNKTICNKCGYEFYISDLSTIAKDDLLVKYFACPACGEKYHVFTSDSKMRELVEQRQAIQTKIRIGHAHKFRKQELQKYAQKLAKINREQKKIMPQLEKLGEEILREEI